MCFELQRIDINHDLPVLAAKRLRHGGAGNICYLVAYVVLAEISKLSFIQALSFEGDQAHWQAGRVEFQDDRRQCAGRQLSQIRHRQIGDFAQVSVGVGSRLKINLDQADAGQRARFNVIDIAAQGEEPLEAAGDVSFNLFWRHPRVEGRDHHYRNVNGREKIDRHSYQNCSPNDCDHQTTNNNEVRVFDCKARHQNLSSWFWATTLGVTRSPGRNSEREPTTTRSFGESPETTSTWFAPSSPS